MYYKLLFLVFIIFNACTQQSEGTKNTEDVFLDSLLSQMSLVEKIGQLNQNTSQWEITGPAPQNDKTQDLLENIKNGKVGSMLNVVGVEATRSTQQLAVENSRLGIPLIFGYDVIHGYQTMFPIPLAEAATWQPELATQAAAIAAIEASSSGLHWTFAPMMDVGRDARWGRVMEGAGEDPYLASLFAVARINGFQGQDLANNQTIAACAKHFAAYAFAEAGRDYNSVEISGYTLHNIVLPPFKASAEAGVATFMNAFNTINGIPATASTYLLRDMLKGAWGFDGFVVSDWNSIGEMPIHGAATDLKEAAKRAIEAGSDMDMQGSAYLLHLENLINEDVIDIKLVDDAVKRILRIKYRLGLFEDPYRYCDTDREQANIYNEENRSAARNAARESMVLLKNDKQLLPLAKTIKSVAVIGPLADEKDVPLGSWRAQAVANSAISLLEGVKAAVSPNTMVHYAKGCDLAINERTFVDELEFNTDDRSGFSEAMNAAKKSEVVLLAIGEDCFQSGEGRSQTDIALKGVQLDLFKAIYKVNKNIVVVLMNGRPVAIPELAETAPAILETWFAGNEAGHAIADIIFGDHNPAGKLPVTFPRNVGQCPIYYNHQNTGRPVADESDQVFWSHYTDAPNTPLYPFGFGLSYSSFSYTDMTLNSDVLSNNETLQVSVTLTNDSQREGREVVQLYIQDIAATYARPVKELKGFKKVSILAGESQTVTFELSAQELGYYFENGDYVVEPGTFNVYVGGNSVDVLASSFILK